ncbi:MAG TPA: hemerythrin family protein [Rhodospirillaceae bacterium]|nr:hemerythrin family protein [Rhodospirillaceae bacterium]
MDVLLWSDEMSVGNDILDNDHKAFLSSVSLLRGSREDRMIVLSVIMLLEEYVDGHFLREEKAMKAANYPHLARHRLRHSWFRARIKAVSEVYQQGNDAVADELPDLVAKWLRQHIIDEDKLYAHWVSRITVDNRPLGLLALEAEQS